MEERAEPLRLTMAARSRFSRAVVAAEVGVIGMAAPTTTEPAVKVADREVVEHTTLTTVQAVGEGHRAKATTGEAASLAATAVVAAARDRQGLTPQQEAWGR